MAILANTETRIIVQGITGGEATKHTALMLKAGTQIVGGVNARKAGTEVTHVDNEGKSVNIPVFGSVAEAARSQPRSAAQARRARTSASCSPRPRCRTGTPAPDR